jgi:hypothetical protein
MKRWSWRQSPGAIRSTALLGIVLATTLGVMYFAPPSVTRCDFTCY